MSIVECILVIVAIYLCAGPSVLVFCCGLHDHGTIHKAFLSLLGVCCFWPAAVWNIFREKEDDDDDPDDPSQEELLSEAA